MEILAFVVEYFDKPAELVREFRLNHFRDGTLELLDHKKRMFLKRVYYPKVSREQLFTGSVINVFGKALQVVRPADEGTKLYVDAHTSSAAALVTISTRQLGAVVKSLQSAFTCLCSVKTVEDAVYVKVFDATGTHAETRLAEALVDWPFQLVSTVSHLDNAAAQGPGTLCLVKPHVLADRKAGDLLDAIHGGGFDLAGAQTFSLDANMAHAFFAAYKGAWPAYEDTVNHFLDGPCLALKIRDDVDAFREFCGPCDVQLARTLRPKSLRAVFGETLVKNAVHCTDMPEDAHLECHFFFRHLAAAGAA